MPHRLAIVDGQPIEVLLGKYAAGISDVISANATWHTEGSSLVITFRAPDTGTSRFSFSVFGNVLILDARSERQFAAGHIRGAVNLPLFLLEGVAILAEVFVLLIVLQMRKRSEGPSPEASGSTVPGSSLGMSMPSFTAVRSPPM